MKTLKVNVTVMVRANPYAFQRWHTPSADEQLLSVGHER